jgi:uncharacterized membrane protein
LARAVGIEMFVRPEDFFDLLVSMEVLDKYNGLYSNTIDVETYCLKEKEEYMG